MNGVIGELLPLAVAVAISPMPVIAAILMLLSPRAKQTSVAFLLGWTLGVIIVIVLFTLLAGVIPEGDDGPQPVIAVIKLLIGAFLVFAAVRQWRRRPRPGDPERLPAWMSAINTMTAVRAALLGLALSAINPKNLAMGVSAGLDIGSAQLDAAAATIAIAIFVVLAISTVAIPVVGFLVAGQRMAGALDRMRAWLVANNAAVMSVLLLVLGVVSIGKGIAGF